MDLPALSTPLVTPVSPAAPVMTAPPAAPAVVSGLGSALSSWLGGGRQRYAPAAAPLLWTVAAFSRSELGGAGAPLVGGDHHQRGAG